MAASLEKFKEIVDASETIALGFGEAPDLSKILSGAILHKIFLELGKKVSADYGRFPENVRNFLDFLFDSKLESCAARENILITLDSKRLPVSELKYEKEGDILKIILESGSTSADPNLISISKKAVPADLLMLIDPPQSEIETLVAATSHKEVVKLGSREKSLAIKTLEIISNIAQASSEKVKEALWILLERETKWRAVPSFEHLKLSEQISALNPDENKLVRAREILYPTSFWKLLGRALARSHFEKDLGAFWVFLPGTDFEKVGAGENMLLEILASIRGLRPESKFFSILWEKEQKFIRALISSSDSSKLGELAALMSTQPASSYFFANGFSSFSEAEIKIRDSIRKIL